MGFPLVQQVIEDMDHYGVCVVDNLLGDARGGAVLREVQNMYSKGAFQDGQLVKSKDGQSKSIRGDKITWVDGREPHCRNISVLIKLLDNIVMGANNRNNNGKLGTYTIKERSKVSEILMKECCIRKTLQTKPNSLGIDSELEVRTVSRFAIFTLAGYVTRNYRALGDFRPEMKQI